MSDRLQWEKFWYRDFCDDLKRVPLDARGFWIFALSEMWGQTKSEITGSFEDFSRICSCTPDEAEKAISELSEYDICDVIFSTKTYNNKDGSNGSQINVKLRNRRLNKEEDLREYNRLAKQRWRENALKKENVKAKSPVEDRGKRIEDRRIKEGAQQGSLTLPSKDELENFSEPKLLKQIEEISEKLYRENIFPKVNTFVNLLKKKKKNLRAILHTLCRIYLSKPEEPWPFGLKISETENGKYNARDYEKTA